MSRAELAYVTGLLAAVALVAAMFWPAEPAPCAASPLGRGRAHVVEALELLELVDLDASDDVGTALRLELAAGHLERGALELEGSARLLRSWAAELEPPGSGPAGGELDPRAGCPS